MRYFSLQVATSTFVWIGTSAFAPGACRCVSHLTIPRAIIPADTNIRPISPVSQQQFIRSQTRSDTKAQLVILSESSAGLEESGDSTWQQSLASLGIGAWFAAISYLIVQNYKFGPWPTWISSRPKSFWVLIHATSSMLFSGAIVVSTMIEWLVVRSGTPDVVKFWFARVSNIDKAVVLPALTGAIVSGFAQAAQEYGCMASAPKHIRLAIHLLATFAMWWGLTDLTTQQSARHSISKWHARSKESSSRMGLPKVLHIRRWSNIVSCMFVLCLYALMALKPGYN